MAHTLTSMYATQAVRSAQQGLEAGLGEVLIVGQGGLDVLCFHDQEAGAVGKAPILVNP